MKRGILPIFIALIVVGSIGVIGGGYTGARYFQAAKYEEKADQFFNNGNYTEASNYYNKSLAFWKKKRVEDKRSLAEKENTFLAALNDGLNMHKQSNWQECVLRLKEISSDSKAYAQADPVAKECQTKIDEEVAKKKTDEATAAAAANKSKTASSASQKSITPTSNQSAASVTSEPAEDLTKCKSNASPVFTNQLIDPSLVINIIPPPNLAQPSGHLKTHSYIDTPSSGVPLYAPIDMVLIKGDYYRGGPYYLDFRVSCEVMLRVAHVTDPIEKIKEAFGSDPDAAAEIEIPTPIAFKAGELFAYSGGPPHVLNNGLDFGVYNSTKPNRYTGSQSSSIYTTAVCPYDYFTATLKAAYKEKFNLSDPVGMSPDGESFCQ